MCLYICNIADFTTLPGLELLPPARQSRVMSYRQPKDRVRCLLSGLLLRRFCGVVADAQLCYGENGKPGLKDHSLCFNISHSGDYVVLATGEDEVGVDIERCRPYHRGVPGRFFQPEEEEWLRQQANDEAFFYLWTGKESVMKLLGLGLALPAQSFSVLPMDSSPHAVTGKTMFFEWLAYQGHIICRATFNAQKKLAAIPITPEILYNEAV